MSEPSVSIIMPAYNREAFIGDAIASLQSETGIAAEIVVVDDGSTDRTVQIVRELSAADERMRLVLQSHAGVSAARSIGIREARGDYVTFLDSDDLSAPGRIARQVGRLAGRPDVSAVVGHSIWFDRMAPGFQPAPGALWERKLDICLGNVTVRRGLFDEIGLFDEALTFAEDVDFYFRLFEMDRRIIIEQEIANFHRRHASNMTRDEPAMFRGVLRAYHNSIQRRRKMGRTRRLDVFFFRVYDTEVEIGGPDESEAAAQLPT